METVKENNLNIPIILKHCFKDIRQVDGSGVNVSAICNVCSKVIKGSVTSTTNFLKHLKRKGHSDLLQDYEKVKNTTLKKEIIVRLVAAVQNQYYQQ